MFDHLVGLLDRVLNSQVTGTKPVQVQTAQEPELRGHRRSSLPLPGAKASSTKDFDLELLATVARDDYDYDPDPEVVDLKIDISSLSANSGTPRSNMETALR